ncbi:MAG: DUF6909 family protein [Bellilinea sp.]
MERTVPRTASEEIDLYLRTIYSLLRTSAEVQIRSLEEVHAATNSSLHPDARRVSPDISALIYSALRLPDCMPEVRSVVLGQSASVFHQHGYDQVESWQPVSARARRRRVFFNGKDTLACYIASRSDIDDIIPTLTAYQIEWNKLHHLLQRWQRPLNARTFEKSEQAFRELANTLEMSVEDLERLRTVWGREFYTNLQRIAHKRCRIGVRLLSGSLADYRRATRAWWGNIERCSQQLGSRPVYFVSSNTHSLINLLTGFALLHREDLMRFLERKENQELKREWESICNGQVPSSQENFLYYVLKKYQQTNEGRALIHAQAMDEANLGIVRIPSEHYFDVEAQVIELRRLNPARMDPRIKRGEFGWLERSDALILNIDYPLGVAAYNLLVKIAEHVHPILGVYIMGKAATLNGRLGDVMIPNVVQDEHSENTFLFQNAFNASHVAPYLLYGTVLDNQKAVSVYGTFLQNARIMDVIYREGYTDIEMEAGPYLSAVYEMFRPKRHPINEVVNLYEIPFDLGILHYASDTPLSKGKNLGAGALSYFGMDSTYAASIAILRRIFEKEQSRLAKK